MAATPDEPRQPSSRLRGRLAALLGRGAAGGASPSPYHATRRRLVAINLAVVSAILLLMTSSIYLVESRALQQQVEQQLRSHADSDIASGAATIAANHSATAPTAPSTEKPSDDTHSDGDNYEPGGPNIFSVILDSAGATVIDASGVRAYGLPDHAAAAPVLSGAQKESLISARIQGQEYLLLTKALYQHDKLVGALQVGQSLAPMEQQTHDLILILLIVGVGGLALTAGASLYLADRALRPMRLAYERQRQFAAAASHELRTPLAFVRSQLELVARHARQAQPDTLAASLGEDLGDTVHEVDYMTRLVRDLLLMARDEGDHRSITWRPVDLRRLARDVAETARPSAEQRGLTLAAPDPAGEDVWVMGDYDRLRQLLLILLDNATRYTPTGGRVWLEVRSGRGSLLGGRRPLAQVIVGDTGVGIAPDQQERIFEAFYRPAGHNASADHGGSGLGLALARWLVSAHDGEIGVKSAPGDGSV
ncbi:MAG TPA: HAMP domain-containing sensor histidine kinase, partial [Ktedonobacterales bacterium]